MSIQLKYRAWDKEANIMVYSDHRTRKLYDVYYGFEMNSKGELECNWEGEFTESHVLDGGMLDNIMQFTGLKDKNGVEIYEGDIVKGFIPEIAVEPERIGAVKFGSYGWIVDFKTKKWECKIGKVGFCSFRDYEIIGNIYENPELLKED